MAAKTEKKENPVQIPVRWMRVEEAAQYLRVSVDFLNKARIRKNPNIPFTRIGGSSMTGTLWTRSWNLWNRSD